MLLLTQIVCLETERGKKKDAISDKPLAFHRIELLLGDAVKEDIFEISKEYKMKLIKKLDDRFKAVTVPHFDSEKKCKLITAASTGLREVNIKWPGRFKFDDEPEVLF